MVRLAIAMVFPVAFLVHALAAGADGLDADDKAPILLTEKDFDRVVKAKNGALIELRLPNSMPYSWALTEDVRVLQPQPAAARTKESPKQAPDAPPPSLGGGRLSVHRYKVSTDQVVNATPMWVYCFGSPENTKRREREGKVPPHKNFSPDLKPSEIKEGMIFQIKLEAHP